LLGKHYDCRDSASGRSLGIKPSGRLFYLCLAINLVNNTS
jgi:hypothetical protein